MAITYGAGPGTHITTHAMTENLPSQAQSTDPREIIVSDLLSVIGGGQIGDGTNGTGDSYLDRLMVKNLGVGGASEEVRLVVGDAVGTGTTRILSAQESWDVAPVATTDTIDVLYELADIEDGGVSNGIGLSTRTGLWELSNDLVIESGGGLAMLEAKALEHDDTAGGFNFQVQSGGWFRHGFPALGIYVSGGVHTMYENTAGELGFEFQSGSHARISDTLMWAQLVTQGMHCDVGSDVVFRSVRMLKQTEECHIYDAQLYDTNITGIGTATEIIRINTGTIMNRCVLTSIQYMDTAADTVSETLEIWNCVFAGVPGQINVRQNKIWNAVNSLTGTADYTDLTWTGTATGNEVNDCRSVTAIVQTSDGILLENALVNIYENTILDDLVLELTTDVAGFAEDFFVYKKHATNSVTTTYGGHALQCGKWLYLPFVAAQAVDGGAGNAIIFFDGGITLNLDNNIVQTNQATAKTAGSTITWNEDTNPSELVAFTLGSGTLVDGMIVTFSPSGAIGTITTLMSGDSVAGDFHMKDRNATAIGATDTFTRTGGAAGSFSGTYTNTSSQLFSIWIDGQDLAMQVIYDYLAAIQNETTLTVTGELIWEWCRHYQTQPLYHTGSSFFTSKGAFLPVDSYPVGNSSGSLSLYSGATTARGQSFTTGAATLLNRARFNMSKVGSPTGTMVAKLYAHSGTYGTSSVPTGSPVATSETVDTTILPVSSSLIEFEFLDGYVMTAVTQYVIVVEYNGGDVSNQATVFIDTTSPTHGGNLCFWNGSWGAEATRDMIFYVDGIYGEGIIVVDGGVGTQDYYTDNAGVAWTAPATVTVQVTVLDDDTGLAIEFAHVQIFESDFTTVVLSGATNASGVVSASYSYTTDEVITGWARNVDFVANDYEPVDISGTITSTGLILTVRLIPTS